MAGIAATVLVLGGLTSVGSLPASGAPPEEYALHFRNYHDRILAGLSVTALGLALTLCFLTGLWATLRRERRELADTLPALGLAAGALRVGLVYGAGAFLLAPAYRFGIGDPAAPKTLADLYAIALVLSAYPTVISLVAFGIAMIQTRALESWLGWFSLLVAAAHLVAASTFAQTGPLAPSGYVGTRLMPVLYYAWVAAVSAALLLDSARAASRETRDEASKPSRE